MAIAIKQRNGLLHIEAEGCIVNIREGLMNMQGCTVTSVEILSDDGWRYEVGQTNHRVIKEDAGIPKTDVAIIEHTQKLKDKGWSVEDE